MFFGDQTFFGTVKSYENKYWRVIYDDGKYSHYASSDILYPAYPPFLHSCFLIALCTMHFVYVGDDEDMDANELVESIKLHRLKKKEDPENN